ncbi:MAG: excinuclease ABC subunit UvrA [Peptostreptococcaceae bacterium]
MNKYIEVKGAKENNLKNISVKIPKNKLVAISGPSGSGKSTFAMDILQRECQRQYMESMGIVTDGMNKPRVDSIMGLSPSISVSQGMSNKNPRSTVGTFTEIFTYLRVLYAKLGERVCNHCGQIVKPSFEEELSDDIYESEESEDNNDFNNDKYVTCSSCNSKLKELKMANFSFNKPEGFCMECQGLGIVSTLDLSSILDTNLTVKEGAFKLWEGIFAEHYSKTLDACATYYGFEFDTSKKVKDYNELEKLVFFKGVESEEFKKIFPNKKPPKTVNAGKVEGIETFLKKKSAESITKGISNKKIESCFVKSVCPECNGAKLNKESRSVLLNNKTIVDVSKFTLKEFADWILSIEDNLSEGGLIVSQSVLNDIKKRVAGVINIGLDYLTIDRTINSLSGGEAQRLRLASLMDSGLTGVLYVLDEPTTGLHPRDTDRLIHSLKKLRDLGNTVLVIEHDVDFINECDYVIDFGPESGKYGGYIVAEGQPKEIVNNINSITGKYLSYNRDYNKSNLPIEKKLTIVNAHEHNLKNISVDIPLNRLVSFTGVSGSGKSSLVFDVLDRWVESKDVKCEKIEGFSNVDKVIKVDQSPIGKISRSNIATYTDIFTHIRNVYASLKESKSRKLTAKHFSFNVKGGRCEKCQGLGVISLDMHFLDNIEVPCPTCRGNRFKKEILEVKFNGFSISDILNMSVEENLEVFKLQKEIYNRLITLKEVGLGYLKLGQSTTTLSGGECQRIKLSKELGKISKGNTLYLLDEPTTGLHPSDIDKLLKLLRKLVDKGNSVIAIEHSLEVITHSDYIIDLGLEGGINGGEIVATGNIVDIMNNKLSCTGKYIKKYLSL